MSGQLSTSGSPGGQGGAIFAGGPARLRACTVSGNVGGKGSAADFGDNPIVAANVNSPAINSENSAKANVRPEMITYSRWGGPGGPGGTGGIFSEAGLNLVLCTLSGNVGGNGGKGGQSYGGYMQFFTGAGGAAGGPGAVCCASSNGVVLVACTIAGNTGGAGGAGGSGDADYSGHTGQGVGGVGGAGGVFGTGGSMINSIVAANAGGTGGAGGPWRWSAPVNGAPDVQGAFTSLGFNLIGAADGGVGFTNGVNGDLAGSTNAPLDAVLGPLADNGGPTLTMALLHGSPALDAGDDALLQWPYRMRTDQRGFARKSGAHVDIGAFEFQYQDGTSAAVQPFVVSGNFAGNGAVQVNVSDPGALAASSGFDLMFSNSTPGATFSVLATSDLSVPVEKWSVVGQAVPVGAGVFQFTDVGATNSPQRFYRVSTP
jgi:hypothetical protein